MSDDIEISVTENETYALSWNVITKRDEESYRYFEGPITIVTSAEVNQSELIDMVTEIIKDRFDHEDIFKITVMKI